MDERTRGFIEKSIDTILETSLVNPVRWVETVTPVKSLQDLSLGFIIGSIATMIGFMLSMGRMSLTENEQREVNAMINRRLPEIVTRIKTELNV
jgi:malonyl CoA-acyl carrier protein transacylase